MFPGLARLFFKALQKYFRDSGAIYAAAIAYAALAAVFPLLLILLVLISPLLQPPGDIEHIINRFLDLPGIGDFLTRNISAVYERRDTLGVAGILGLVIGASSVFGAIESALNRIWGVKGRGWIMGRIAVFLALMIFAFALLGILAAIMFGLRSLRDSPLSAGLPLPYGPALLAVVAPPFVLLTLFFLAYKFLPHTRVGTRAALTGALVAMILAEIALAVLTWYLGSIADYGRLYNTAGAVFALLTWLYVLATVFLLGAEVSAKYQTQSKEELQDRPI
jgi:membrane protein